MREKDREPDSKTFDEAPFPSSSVCIGVHLWFPFSRPWWHPSQPQPTSSRFFRAKQRTAREIQPLLLDPVAVGSVGCPFWRMRAAPAAEYPVKENLMNFQYRQYVFSRYALPLVLAVALLASLSAWSQPPAIATVMDELVATLCEGRDMEALSALDDAAIVAVLTPEQRRILGTEYWQFDVNAPALISVMRETGQQAVPFWLEEQGFTKTDLVVRNEHNTYEVWQKEFPAGRVGLGINGFDRHRPHYFVGVGPQAPEGAVAVANISPPREGVYAFAEGATVYHDWPDLTLTDVPEAFQGHLLLPTIRGRAREAQLIGVFRETQHPSSDTPDMVVLTWSDDPATTQTIQWRTSPTSPAPGTVHYREAGGDAGAPWLAAEAESVLLDDRNMLNDRKVRWHRATLAGLQPGTAYEYVVGDAPGEEAPHAEFRTAPAADESFTFLWMSDTHNRDESVPPLERALEKHPDTAFLTISGDLVGTGQQRDDWDRLFHNFAFFLRERPLMPSIGNHDAIDGLGSELYRTLLHLPDNGPDMFERGQSFSLRYGNLLLISLDVTADIAAQRPWLEETLRDTDALWKVAVLHFPPYALERNYPDIEREWCTVFEQHGLDLALSGHVHYHLRTWPLKDGAPVEPPETGVRYLVSVAIPGRAYMADAPPWAEVLKLDGKATCTAFTIQANRLVMHAYTDNGEVYDVLTIEKP